MMSSKKFEYVVPERSDNNVGRIKSVDWDNPDRESLSAHHIPYVYFEHINDIGGFDGAKTYEKGIAFSHSGWPWLSERQVDELITALMYWKKEYGNGTV